MSFEGIIQTVNDWVLGWPLMSYVIIASNICTTMLGFIQVRSLVTAWRVTLKPKKATAIGDMTPFQAFVNTLSSNLGNGSIAGMATALFLGGPGAALWVVIAGILLMSVRFAEVYISTLYGERVTASSALRGPMLYLRYIFGGRILAYTYALFCLFFGLIMGNAVQANSIGLSLTTTWGVQPELNAVALLAFTLYVLLGGAARIVRVSDKIVPVKVGVFFLSAFIVLAYHWRAVGSALWLIVTSAFSPVSLAGGLAGFTIQQAISNGIFYSIMASESGLGSAAILFGFTGSREPVSTGFMGMISAFVSTLVCFLVMLCIIASGVWNSGLTSTALTIAAYSTVFGSLGGWIVSFLSITFGIGVLVTYAYVTRAAWLFLTNNRFERAFIPLYAGFTFLGALTKVNVIWQLATLTNAGMLAINLYGILYLLPEIHAGVMAYYRGQTLVTTK